MGASEEFMEEMGAVVNSTVVLHCDVTGHPAPAVSWLKDRQPVQTDSQHHISEDGTQLQVSLWWLLDKYQRVNVSNGDTFNPIFQLLSVQVSDMAGYLCVAENKVGTVEKLFSLTVQGKKKKALPLTEDSVSVMSVGCFLMDVIRCSPRQHNLFFSCSAS